MLALTFFRSEAAGLLDLLDCATLVDEGIMLDKDGSLTTDFFFRGDNVTSATTLERNYLTALVNQYLSHFGAGWSLWTDASRLPSPGYPHPNGSFFPEPVMTMINAKHRAPFVKDHALFESEYALILTCPPPTRRDLKLSGVVYNDDSINDTDPADRLLTDFKKKLDDLQDGLGDLLHMRRMDTVKVGEDDDAYQNGELINYLYYMLANEPITLCIPDCSTYLDAWLGCPSLWPGDTPEVGDKFVSYVTIEGFPGSSCPGILDMFDTLPMTYR